MQLQNLAQDLPELSALSHLLSGESGTISELTLEGEEYDRVTRIGITPGRRVVVLSAGSRILLHISGATCALDSKLATGILVLRDS